MLTRSPLCRVVVIAMPLLWLTLGCQRSNPVEEGIRDNILIMNPGSEPSTLDPHRNTGSPESYIISALWEPLVDWNADATDVVPAAAESWTLSDDGRTYTFHLRPDAQWSNGDPVTADQWVRSFQRWITPSIAGELANFADPVLGAFDYRTGQSHDFSTVGFRAPDDHTFVIELHHPHVGFLHRLTNYPWVPVHPPSIESIGDFYNPMTNFIQPGQLITNGPFMLTEWAHDQYVQVMRNPHFNRSIKLDGIRFLLIENLDTAERAYRSNQLHITSGLPTFKIPGYQAAHDPALSLVSRVGIRYLMTNTTRPPFDDARVRRAFALAMNREKLTSTVLRTGGAPAYSFIGPVPGDHQPSHLFTESAEEARRLLAEAGYPHGEGFPPTEYLYNTLDRNREVAEALQQMWQTTLGVKISIRNEEWKVFLDTRHRLDFQIARAGWLPFTASPLELYELVTKASGSNESGWTHERYEALYAEALHTLDPAARFKLLDEMDKILREEMPVIPTAYYRVARLVHPSVDGWPTNHLEAHVWRHIGLKR
jgi:oligopeptide transport system substrate-binding protein